MNVVEELLNSQADDDIWRYANPEPSVENDEAAARRKFLFASAKINGRSLWKISHQGAVVVVFLSLTQSAAMRALVIDKVSDLWWRDYDFN